MKVNEFIEWLKTRDQEATVQVLMGVEKFHEQWIIRETFDPERHVETKSGNERVLTLGGEEY